MILTLNTNKIYSNLKCNVNRNVTFLGKKNQCDTFTSNLKLNEKEISALKKEMNKHPNDIQYRKKLLIETGINPAEFYKLRSIIGSEELKDIVKELSDNKVAYSPGERNPYCEDISDSHDLRNLKTGNFRANFHIHSNNSDGKMTVQEILDNANEYANYLKKTKNKPFYIAITDHNTVDGCKEAIDIIRKNPKKYENLRVVLGCELTLKMDSIGEYELKKPQTVHLLAMGVNPYDKILTEFLYELTDGNKNPMNTKKILFADAIKILTKQKFCSFALAHPAWPYLPNNMKKPESYINAIKKYIDDFAQGAKDQALYVENYYQSYDGQISQDKKLLKEITEETKRVGLYCGGGIDTHGTRIFYCDSKE